MNARTRLLVILLGAMSVGGAVLVRRHSRGAMGKEVPGGILAPVGDRDAMAAGWWVSVTQRVEPTHAEDAPERHGT